MCLWRCINLFFEEFLRLMYRDLYTQVNEHNSDRFSFTYVNQDMVYEVPNPIIQQPSAGKFSKFSKNQKISFTFFQLSDLLKIKAFCKS